MKILFSPSETKDAQNAHENPINKNSFIFKNLFKFRLEALSEFENYIAKADFNELCALFGVKEPMKFKNDLRNSPTKKAIELYSGVSFSHLKFDSLDKKAREFLLEKVLIFSNLFGPVLAGDFLPFYKLKQGAKIGNFELESFYKKHFSSAIDEFLDEEILDLRAGFYDKFYTPKKDFFTFKFLKNGKIISHFAKAWRGILLRHIAQKQIKSKEELLENLSQNLRIKECKKIGLKEEIILEIL